MFKTIVYWVATALTAFVFLSGGVADVLRPNFALQGMTHLGYPPYFMVILGVWKVLGGIVILSPRGGRLNEWAYAGIFFDLSGAAASHAFAGDPINKVIAPLIIILIVVASWALRPASRRMDESMGVDAGAMPQPVA